MQKLIILKKINKAFSFILIFFIFVGFFSCQSNSDDYNQFSNWMEDNGKIKVLSSTEMIGSIVKQIGKDYVDNLTLIQKEQDPHSYELIKGDDEKLQRATIIFYNGLGLEHGAGLQYFLFNSSKAIALGDDVVKCFPNKIIYVDKEKDPHIWMDISLWAKIIDPIVKILSKYDSPHAEQYKNNAKKLFEDMMQAHKEIKEQFKQIPPEKRYLVTSHDAFNYFTKAYLATEEEKKTQTWRERFSAPEGLAPEGQISVIDVKRTIDFLNKHKIHILFLEANINPDSIEKILSSGMEMGMQLSIADEMLYGDTMGRIDSTRENNYVSMIRHNARVIHKNLCKKNE